jgi:hypothetical protein
MIVQWFVQAVFAVITWAVGLLPSWTAPDWMTGSGSGSIAGYGASIAGYASKLSNWVPLGLLATVATVVLGACAVAVAVKVTRIVLSALMGGGGGAG